jgi:hypothetical protein
VPLHAVQELECDRQNCTLRCVLGLYASVGRLQWLHRAIVLLFYALEEDYMLAQTSLFALLSYHSSEEQ